MFRVASHLHRDLDTRWRTLRTRSLDAFDLLQKALAHKHRQTDRQRHSDRTAERRQHSAGAQHSLAQQAVTPHARRGETSRAEGHKSAGRVGSTEYEQGIPTVP